MSGRLPLYLVAGDDDHLLRRELERLIGELRATEPDLDVEVVDAVEADSLPELRTASLFGGGRCVVVRGAESPKAALKAELEDYVSAPDPEATLVVVARGVGRIQKIAKGVEAAGGERRDVKAPAPWDDRGWAALIGAELAHHGRRGDDAAVAALRQHAGNDAGIIASKVSQVVAAAAADEPITAEQVERVVEGQGNQGGFAVADAVERRDPQAAISALRGALASGEAPLAILGALVHRVRQLLQVRGGVPAGEIGVSGGRLRMLERSARAFGPGELAWVHDRLARADVDLKGSDLPDDVVIEIAVIEAAEARDVGAPWNPLAAAGSS